MVELVVRVVLSLGVVLGLFWMVARTGSRRLGGKDRALVNVRTRQSLSRSASLAVVEVGSRVLVVGISDSGVRLLTEMRPEELEDPAVAGSGTAPGPTALAPTALAPTGDGEPVSTGYPDYADRFSARFVPDEAYGPDYAAAYAPDARPAKDHPLSGSVLDGGVWKGAWATVTRRTHRHGNAA